MDMAETKTSLTETETPPTEAPVDAIEPEISPSKGPHDKLDRKTLFVFLGFFLALVVLVVLNMN
jgi:hypothetical protein